MRTKYLKKTKKQEKHIEAWIPTEYSTECFEEIIYKYETDEKSELLLQNKNDEAITYEGRSFKVDF